MATIVPVTCRKLVAGALSTDFRKVVSILSNELKSPDSGEIIVKNKYVGINASDINWTAGRYDPTAKPPLDCGFEGIGEIVAVGDGVKHVKVGQPVTYMQHGAFSDYIKLNAKQVFPVKSLKAEYLTLLVSGLTAALALDKVAEIKPNDKVLVTAAAGGTGQFAVQLAKLKGCHVIGTCSSDEKCAFLKSIGCDRPINYKKEKLSDVLSKEYGVTGIDVVYECVGGEMFETALANMAVKGRLVIIGYISNYESESGYKPMKILQTVPARLLKNSSSIRGFFLNHFIRDMPECFGELCQLYENGQLKLTFDQGEKSDQGTFQGLPDIYRAIEYLYTGKSAGKIVVEVDDEKQQHKL